MIEDRINFIGWLINRLIYRHHYADRDPIIMSLKDIQQLIHFPKDINIEDDELDQIIIKYYADFNIDKCDGLNIGFTENERVLLRKSIRNITNDILGILQQKE